MIAEFVFANAIFEYPLFYRYYYFTLFNHYYLLDMTSDFKEITGSLLMPLIKSNSI